MFDYPLICDKIKSIRGVSVRYRFIHLIITVILAISVVFLSISRSVLHSRLMEMNVKYRKSQTHVRQLSKEYNQRFLTWKQEDRQQEKVIHLLLQKNDQLSQENHEIAKQLLKEKGEWERFKLTYYDAYGQSTGKDIGDKGFGITKSGRPVKAGVTIAVDPKVIPLDSWVLIKFSDGHIEKRRADDVGGAINGKHIDYYVPEARLSMGTQTVQVKVLKEG